MGRVLFHVMPGRVGWQCRRDDDHVVGTFATFEDALAVAHSLAEREPPSEVLVHLPDGTELSDVLFE